MRGLWLTLALAGCGLMTDSPADPSTLDPQLPPVGDLDLKGWLQQEYYASWTCGAPGEPAGSSPHGRSRICRNEALANSSGEELPEGAAAVQELMSADDLVVGFTVSRKVRSGVGADGWYWYERVRSLVYTDDHGASGCASCHQHAGQQAAGGDFVFTR